MNIGEAARRSGVSAKMVRYYEGIGLIAPASRTGSGYRSYTPADVHVLQFIRRARDFGMPIDRVKQLLALWGDDHRASRDVKALALRHVAELRAKVAELGAMADALQDLADQCDGDGRPDCPILKDITAGGTEPAPPAPGRGFRDRLAGPRPR